LIDLEISLGLLHLKLICDFANSKLRLSPSVLKALRHPIDFHNSS
jgi:hypothetical protein